MGLFQNLKPMTVSLFVILAMTTKAYSQSEATSFTYDFYGDKTTTLTYQGDAFFPSDSTFLRLTKTDAAGVPEKNSVGRALYTEPILFRAEGAVASFETTIDFQITSREGDNNPADGLAFFMAPVGSTIPAGSFGGGLGVYNVS
ncbi:agglutinin-2-like [Salvia hispanica]|uniref:agglutinin-2-like n=1 Tax=Salvia hispanica TaxID=49212 RepID=UPI0020093EA3|nr:agglutinin-2-like [Salvia hispanica]